MQGVVASNAIARALLVLYYLRNNTVSFVDSEYHFVEYKVFVTVTLFCTDNGKYHYLDGSELFGNILCYAITGRIYGFLMWEEQLEFEMASISALYWVAKQQLWSDMADHFIPYFITAIASKTARPEGPGGFGQVTKRQKL
jgi:hypothetical protein